MTATVLEKEDLRVTIADVLDVDVEDVTDEANFVNDLGIDSLMAMEVLVVLERKYAVKLEESELPSITSLELAYKMLEGKLATA